MSGRISRCTYWVQVFFRYFGRAMNKCRLTFNVKSLTLVAAVGLLENEEHVKKAVDLNYESLELIPDYCEENHLDSYQYWNYCTDEKMSGKAVKRIG